MRIRFKKVLSVLLAVLMMAAMAVPAFASGTAADIVINGSAKEYSAYKLLDLTTALICQEEHDHTDACYTFRYEVNSKYVDILKDKTGKSTDDDILAYIKALQGDDIKTFSNGVYMAIKTAGLVADKATTNGTIFGADQGYYLIAETSVDDNGAASLVMLDTAGQVKVSIDAKEGVPTVKKEVMETDDTGDVGYTNAADADVADAVKFQLTGTMPSNIADFMAAEGAKRAYQYTFTDTMSSNLSLNVDSIVVKIDGVKVASGYDTTGSGDQTLIVSFSDLFAAQGENGSTFTIDADTVVTVEFSATLSGGTLKNTNEVTLTYSNDPYSDGTGTTLPADVAVYTYSLVIAKTDDKNNALDGASFTLKKWNGTDAYEDYTNGAEAAVTEQADGSYKVTFTGLDAGKYELSETVVPDGYTGIKPIEFTITSTIDDNGDLTELAATADDAESTVAFAGDAGTGAISVTIVNVQGGELPTTGGSGIIMMSIVAVCLIAAGGVAIMVAKKKSRAR